MDFRHPFITNRKLAIFYGAFWVAGSALLLLLFVFANKVPFWTALTEVFTFFILYAIIGSAIWYVIKFSTLENNSIGRIVLAHVVAATIIVFIWVYTGVALLKIVRPSTNDWIQKTISTRLLMGYVLYIIYVIFFYAVNYYFAFKEKSKNESKLKELVKEAELQALKSQINPHFLFNSLNSISSLTMTDPAKAQEMVINLSLLMRYSLKHDRDEKVSVEQEIENNRLYLSIEKVRFGKKLNPVFAVEKDSLKAKIPNMILQPLYENAIKYGVYEAIEPVDVITHCSLSNNQLVVSISNSYDTNAVSKKGEGIGLRNIRDRLQLLYKNPHLLRIVNHNSEFTVTLTIPQNL